MKTWSDYVDCNLEANDGLLGSIIFLVTRKTSSSTLPRAAEEWHAVGHGYDAGAMLQPLPA